jgi:hypothetical protein
MDEHWQPLFHMLHSTATNTPIANKWIVIVELSQKHIFDLAYPWITQSKRKREGKNYVYTLH